MKTNIVTPIAPEMLETLPKGYAIYGNGSDDFAALVARAGNRGIIAWFRASRWRSGGGGNLRGNHPDFIYAVPIGSVLYSLLCEDETQNEEPMTIAQMLGVTEFPFEIRDKEGRVIYYESADRVWWRREYDPDGNERYCENYKGLWEKREFGPDGKETYFEDSLGVKRGHPSKIVIDGITYKKI